MRADAPENVIAFDGFGELLCVKPGPAGQGEDADAELIAAGTMPGGRDRAPGPVVDGDRVFRRPRPGIDRGVEEAASEAALL